MSLFTSKEELDSYVQKTLSKLNDENEKINKFGCHCFNDMLQTMRFLQAYSNPSPKDILILKFPFTCRQRNYMKI